MFRSILVFILSTISVSAWATGSVTVSTKNCYSVRGIYYSCRAMVVARGETCAELLAVEQSQWAPKLNEAAAELCKGLDSPRVTMSLVQEMGSAGSMCIGGYDLNIVHLLGFGTASSMATYEIDCSR